MKGPSLGDREFHDPAVPTEAFVRVQAAVGDPGVDPASAQVAAGPQVVVRIVRVQLSQPASRALTASPFDRGQAIQSWLHEHGVVVLGPGACGVQRQRVGVE